MNTIECNCTEAFLETKEGAKTRLFPAGNKKHDCEYIRWRHSFITQAEKTADQFFSRVRQSAQWSRAFHAAMNDFTRVKP